MKVPVSHRPHAWVLIVLLSLGMVQPHHGVMADPLVALHDLTAPITGCSGDQVFECQRACGTFCHAVIAADTEAVTSAIQNFDIAPEPGADDHIGDAEPDPPKIFLDIT